MYMGNNIEVVMTLGKVKFKWVVKSVSDFTIDAMAKAVKRVYHKHKNKSIVEAAEDIIHGDNKHKL